jgi:hypothetical protein
MLHTECSHYLSLVYRVYLYILFLNILLAGMGATLGMPPHAPKYYTTNYTSVIQCLSKNDLVCIFVHVFVYLIHNIRVVGFCVLFIILIYFVLQIPSNLSIVFVHPWPLLTSPEVKTPLSILHVPITGTTNKYSDTYRTMSHI